MMGSPQQSEDRRAERLARLEANVEILLEQGRENREEHRNLVDQIVKIRTTDFRILVGLLISGDLAILGLMYRALG
ncbi:hypothetical protein [Pseudoduganella sp. RAF53_2]|uniref:hypothetical protein n=1 Tax=unclassified Pseudoduganella TaxID=2637179 RepID=UPI003F972C9F